MSDRDSKRDDRIFDDSQTAWQRWLRTDHFSTLDIPDMELAKEIFHAGFCFAADMSSHWPEKENVILRKTDLRNELNGDGQRHE